MILATDGVEFVSLFCEILLDLVFTICSPRFRAWIVSQVPMHVCELFAKRRELCVELFEVCNRVAVGFDAFELARHFDEMDEYARAL